MSLTDLKTPGQEKRAAFGARALAFLDRLMRLGVSGHDRETRRRLSICNIAGYLAALSSISFAINFALKDAAGLKWLIAGNLASAVITMTTPLWHRISPVGGPSMLAVVVGTTLFFFISELGRDSGIGLNYIGCVAIAFAMFGLENMRIILVVVAACIISLLATHFLFPVGRVQHLVDDAFIAQTYIQSATSIMLLLALVVWYAFSIAADAERRTELLLKNVLPGSIAERLREDGDRVIADKFDEASVMFADIVGFTELARKMNAEQLVDLLNTVFSEFDRIGKELGVEKIKTIGDAYMAVSGVPEPNDSHARDIMKLALGLQKALAGIAEARGLQLTMRIGIATGPITAGVIGKTRFAYDVWSTTVNLASRLESHGEPGCIRICQATYIALKGSHEFEKLPPETIKGVGRVTSWRVKA